MQNLSFVIFIGLDYTPYQAAITLIPSRKSKVIPLGALDKEKWK